jgi:hypothetical protein
MSESAKPKRCGFCREPLGPRYFSDVPPDRVDLCLDCHKDHVEGNHDGEGSHYPIIADA